jgi:hypothetical protein
VAAVPGVSQIATAAASVEPKPVAAASIPGVSVPQAVGPTAPTITPVAENKQQIGILSNVAKTLQNMDRKMSSSPVHPSRLAQAKALS